MDIFYNICAFYEDIPSSSPMIKLPQDTKSQKMPSSLPRAFFDGAEQNGFCGCGFHIVTDEDSSFSIHWNGGRGSNMMAKVMALSGFLSFCLFLDLHDVSIYGDSQVLVNYVAGKNSISKAHLASWLDWIWFLWNSLIGGSIKYIRRELNQDADRLSKKELLHDPELWHLQVSSDGKNFFIQDFFPPYF